MKKYKPQVLKQFPGHQDVVHLQMSASSQVAVKMVGLVDLKRSKHLPTNIERSKLCSVCVERGVVELSKLLGNRVVVEVCHCDRPGDEVIAVSSKEEGDEAQPYAKG